MTLDGNCLEKYMKSDCAGKSTASLYCLWCFSSDKCNEREEREKEKIMVLIQSNSDNDISACEQQKLQNRLEFSGKSEHP